MGVLTKLMDVLDELKENGEATITTLEKSGKRVQLHIEYFTPEEELNWKSTLTILTHSYEVSAAYTNFEEDLTYSIHEIDGRVFRLPESEVEGDSKRLKFTCILTERKDGEIIIPEDAFDEGYFRVPPGTYRLYETWEDIEG